MKSHVARTTREKNKTSSGCSDHNQIRAQATNERSEEKTRLREQKLFKCFASGNGKRKERISIEKAKFESPIAPRNKFSEFSDTLAKNSKYDR